MHPSELGKSCLVKRQKSLPISLPLSQYLQFVQLSGIFISIFTGIVIPSSAVPRFYCLGGCCASIRPPTSAFFTHHKCNMGRRINFRTSAKRTSLQFICHNYLISFYSSFNLFKVHLTVFSYAFLSISASISAGKVNFPFLATAAQVISAILSKTSNKFTSGGTCSFK